MFTSIVVFYLVILVVFMINSSHLLVCLILLEIMTFLCLLAISSTLTLHSSYVVVLLFCLFVLESIIGLVGFLNLIYFGGSDYLTINLFSN